MLFSVIPRPASLSVSPSDATIKAGENMTMTCSTSSFTGSITYVFQKEGTHVQNSTSATYTMTVDTSSSGSYTCTAAINGMTSAASTGHDMTVIGETILSMPVSEKRGEKHLVVVSLVFTVFKVFDCQKRKFGFDMIFF